MPEENGPMTDLSYSSLTLASASPRRLDLLRQIGVTPKNIHHPNIDETPKSDESPRHLVERLATLKALAGANKFSRTYVLGADTVVACGRKILGKAENNEIEKRIFLQLLDFLWRSHLQYLEHLRQVVGLRSYGQKDPLSEFRKEAFQLFEQLLLKIKSETIKFMLNLNVVVEKDSDKTKSVPFEKKQKISRNSPCTCGSGKKYKHCCGRAA